MIGLCIRNAKFEVSVGVAVVQLDGLCWVCKGQKLPIHIVPQVVVGLVGQNACIFRHLLPQTGGVGGVVRQIKGSAVNGVQFDAVRCGDVVRPKGTIVVGVAPNPRNECVLLCFGKIALLDVEPILLDGRLFGAIQVDAQVADGFVLGDIAPMNER